MTISLLVLVFLVILLSHTITKTNTTHAIRRQCLEHEKSTLLEMRNQLVFDSSRSSVLVLWNVQTDDCCRWEGVGCDNAGHVIRLQLDYEGISGGLNESSSLFSLVYLKVLTLSYNAFDRSHIPKQILKLTHLTTLDLSNCSLQGHFPEVIFQLPTLQILDLSLNPSLGGNIPQLPQNNSFRSIVLSFTNFSGSLPHSIANLQHLSKLSLYMCRFSGVIPLGLGNLTRLYYLDLSSNFFTGSISSIQFEGLLNVNAIYLNYNSLSGAIPMSLFTLPSLESLHLEHNQLGGQVSEFPIVNISKLLDLDLSSNRLEGPIPNSFFNLQGLSGLYLHHNMFDSTLQLHKILSFPNLTYLDLSSNKLSLLDAASFIPTSSFNMSLKQSSLYHLDLSDNKIGGEIPSWIWGIGNGSLASMNMSCNMLVGLQKPYNIPASLLLDTLDLHSNQLQGELPPLIPQAAYVDLSNNCFDKLGILGSRNVSAPSLYYLKLKNNSLSGSLPTSLCKARKLALLDLSHNNLSGSLLSCLFENVEILQVLNLGRNSITGQIPHKFSSKCILLSLDLSNNLLVGDVPLSLGNCSLLVVINLSYNNLSGTIPSSLGLLEKLAVLNLGKNNITGCIPKFTADSALQYLVLGNNNLIGEVPFSLRNCRVLVVMNVGGNHIDGAFPCMLPLRLRVLVLRSNQFHGSLKCNNKSWPNLQIIDIAHNNFSGSLNPLNWSSWRGMMKDTVTKLSYKTLDFATIYDVYYREEVTLTVKGFEQQLVKIWPDFTSIDLSCNNLKGDIPDSIAGLNALYLLNLSHNSLTGTIPKLLGNLTFLGALDLSTNRLTGKIPKEIAGLTFLQLMNVSYNKLIGEIPTGSQIQTFPADCFEGNLGLCGLPLNVTCTCTRVSSPPMRASVESKGGIEWGYVFGVGGYVVGLGISTWVLLCWRSFREEYFEKIDRVTEKMLDHLHRQCNKIKERNRRRIERNKVRRQERFFTVW